MQTRIVPIALAGAVLTLALGACGGSSSSSDGGPACDAETLLAAANANVTNDAEKASAMNGVACDGEFAVGFATMGSGDGEIEVTDVFQAVDGAWTLVDRNAVCGSIDMNAPAERPTDAQVPESIWVQACNTN